MNETEAPQQTSDPPPGTLEPPGTPEPLAEEQPLIAKMQGVWERIKHHKVVQWTFAYLAIAYTLLHGAEMLTGSLGWPHGWIRLFTWLLILGVPIVVTLAWYHGSRGQQRASGTEVMIIAILLALGGTFLWRDSTDHGQATETNAVATPTPAAALPVIPIAPDIKSIAVLPFVDMSAERNQEHMSDGIAEELLNLLAQVPDLKVIARTSSFSFKGQNIDVSEIARKLNVAHVLEGSVRTSGDRLRITAQLVRTADSTHLWSERYDRPLDDIFAVQDEIANAIVQALEIQLKGGTSRRRAGGTQNLEAYHLYLQAVSATNLNTKASLDAAENYANQAVTLDPNYGLAWLQLAYVAAQKQGGGYLSTQEGYERMEQLTRHALQLSPDLAGAHALLHDLYLTRDLNWAAARTELQRALAIDPTNPHALFTAAAISSILGEYDEAERQMRAVMQRDPLDANVKIGLAGVYYATNRLAEAEGLARSVLELHPDYEWTRSFLARILLLQGKVDAALAELKSEPVEGARIAVLPMILHAAGRQAEADEALKAMIEYWADEYAQGIARNYAYMGDRDRAMQWLERAYQQKDPSLFGIIDDPLYGSLFEDPRYKAFLRNKLKIPG